ncbi:MAG: hypothetical protein IJZ95_01940 [Oscillospiraceae bacterium]|nr:hypothetical protein [Oscillospiraceae bacterium]
MKERYNRMFDEIAPARSDDELYNAVLGKAADTMSKKRISLKTIIIPIVAAVTLAASVVGVGAAVGGSNIVSGKLLDTREHLLLNVVTDYYTDKDDHVHLAVEEYITDGQRAFLTLRYTALDDEGKEWLNGFDPSNSELNIYPNISVTGGFGNREIEEYRTETERCYYLEFDVDIVKTDEILFTYPMTEETRTEIFTLDENTVRRKLYKLVGEGSPTELYQPTCIALSELDYTIYGKNIGLYEWVVGRYGNLRMESLITDEESHMLLDIPIYFVYQDGRKRRIFLTIGPGGVVTPSEENGYSDTTIASGIQEPGYLPEYTAIKHTLITLEGLVGVQIGDCYYELEEIE